MPQSRPALGRRSVIGLSGAGLLALAGCGSSSDGSPPTADPSAPTSTTSRASTAAPSRSASPTTSPTSSPTAAPASGSVRVMGTVTSGLDVPWGLGLLPDGSVLISTRDDFHLYRLDVTSGRRVDLGVVPGVSSNVDEYGEGGLLGLAVSPRFARDRRVYLYWSTTDDNRIGWVRMSAHGFGDPHVIVSGIPHGVHHNGGRLAFGPDGYLYAGTGESEVPALAQDKGSLGGKVLRMTRSGRPAPGNPFGSLVYSYGHRNVQGLVFDSGHHLFASEFGDHEVDELNWIRPGRNYGWPMTQGSTDQRGLTSPVTQFGTEEDSPSGIAIANGAVWMAALQGERLWRIPLDGTRLVADPKPFLVGELGRLRSVLALDDRRLLVTTSNRDGRSTPGPDDDRVVMLRVS